MSSIRVALISNNQTLAKDCQEILGQLFGSDWVFAGEGTSASLPPHDLCIWDFDPLESQSLSGLDPLRLQACFFLLDRKHLPLLQQLAGTSDLHILLKPVTPATLAAVLSETCRMWKEQTENPSARIGTLRAERDDMLQCLLQANLKLQEYDQERTNFLARSIHDFRAPLTAIAGYCSLLLEEQLGPITGEQREILERMQRSTKRLTGLASGMLQLSVAQKVDQPLNLREGDIRDCITQALHETTRFIEGKRIIVTTDIEPAADPLFFEGSRMEQLLVNLLDNACKFTPTAGRIDIKGYSFFWERRIGQAGEFNLSTDRRIRRLKAPNCFRVDIQDSGPGISPVHLGKIFEEYTSYGGGNDRSGGGLGLAICKMIARQHQGKVWAENTPAGPVFSFVLPFRQMENRISLVTDGLESRSRAV